MRTAQDGDFTFDLGRAPRWQMRTSRRRAWPPHGQSSERASRSTDGTAGSGRRTGLPSRRTPSCSPRSRIRGRAPPRRRNATTAEASATRAIDQERLDSWGTRAQTSCAIRRISDACRQPHKRVRYYSGTCSQHKRPSSLDGLRLVSAAGAVDYQKWPGRELNPRHADFQGANG